MSKTEIDDGVKERLKEYVDDDDNLVTSQKRLVTQAVEEKLDKLEGSNLNDFETETEEEQE